METRDITKQEEKLIEENQKLKSAVEELSILNEIATTITSIQPPEEIIDIIVKKCIKHLRVEQGSVTLLDEKDLSNPFHTMIRKQDTKLSVLPYRLNTQLTGWMLKNRSPLCTNNLASDSRFSFLADKTLEINSILSVPLTVKGKMIGLLTVFNKRTELGFTIDDQRLLGIIAAQSAHVIENARLYLEEKELLQYREEMKLASEIQTRLLPKSQPELIGYKIAGKSVPASEVGGDFYDFISIDNNNLAFCLGDVSGKGIPAALLMANLQSVLRGQTLTGNSCKECVTLANNILYHNTASNKFATLFYGTIDISNHELTYCNAGHNMPLYLSSDNKITPLESGGMAAGIMPWIPYEEIIMSFKSGDLMILFSDGITEAMNSKDEEFGEERLINLVTGNRNRLPEELINIIFKEVNDFSGNKPQADDMTLVIIERE